MKNTTYILVISLLLMLILSGCKDYLDLKGNNTRAVPVSLDDLQALLNDAVRMNQERTPSMIENWSDDYFVPPSSFEGLQESFQRIYLWDLETYNHPNDWSTGYQAVYNANFCLEGLQKIDRVTENQHQYDRISGAALFFRAYYFQKLLWAFAPLYDESTASSDLGIVLKEDTDFNTKSVRSSVHDCYVSIIKDVERAIPLLPEVATVPTQPSKAAAHALLARTYLSMRRYEQTLFHAEETLKLKSDLMDYNKAADGVFLTRTLSFDRYNKETIFYSEMNSSQGMLYSGGRGGRVDTVLALQYDAQDLRRQAFLRASQGYFQFKGSYSNNRFFSGIATDEVLLMKAETLARLDRIDEAMGVLNHLLRFRYSNILPFIARTAENMDQALTVVLQERRKELLLRGLRLMDIKRLNKEGANISIKRVVRGQTYILEPFDNRAIVPIPTDLESFVQ